MQQYAVDVILDTNTEQPYLILSEDGKQLTLGDTKQSLHDNPPKAFHRDASPFVWMSFVWSTILFTYGKRLRVKNPAALQFLTQTSVPGNYYHAPFKGTYIFCLVYSPLWRSCLHLCPLLIRSPRRLRVFVDYEMSQVSFYDVEASFHINSITGYTFTEKLYSSVQTLMRMV
ncbi:unnamed protein product [Oncorhynchus mykiss]|uniref:B30.2/SPRY domain-containing protein n=1 Tax=Oncorhynchus mykiss TaxID=8022 RepID=A0A060YS43_ONCMY|nr:unnamed protein product [Oncorhynchus mykiss]